MAESFAIRTATLADVATIVSHRRAMFEEMGYANRAALDLMDSNFKTWVAEKIASADYRHWFATNESGAIVAGAGVWIMEWAPHPIDSSGRRGNIMNVYTHRDHRKRGLAKRLNALILAWCRDKSIQTVVLNASEAGRPIYESLGFSATNEMRIQLPPEKENA